MSEERIEYEVERQVREEEAELLRTREQPGNHVNSDSELTEIHSGEEPIAVETSYIWEAIYDNGASSLVEWERRENGEVVQHPFSHIQLEHTTAMILHHVGPEEGRGAVSVKLSPDEGMRPIFFRRHQSTFNMETGEVTPHPPIHVLGWQRTVRGVNVSCYLFVFPDGSLLLSDDHTVV